MPNYPKCPDMPADFDIEVVPVVSTCHITAQDNVILSDLDVEITGLCSRYEYGWDFTLAGLSGEDRWTTITAMQAEGLSASLTDALVFFKDLGYSHVKFDRDGDTVADLPKFEW
jgi:hypothetical protein